MLAEAKAEVLLGCGDGHGEGLPHFDCKRKSPLLPFEAR